MATKAFPPVAGFGVAFAFALMCTWIAIGARDIEATQPGARISVLVIEEQYAHPDVLLALALLGVAYFGVKWLRTR
jgi:hypothetical protein